MRDSRATSPTRCRIFLRSRIAFDGRVRYYVLYLSKQEPFADRRCVPIAGLRGNDPSSPDDLPSGLTIMWPGKLTLDDIMHAAADTQREMAASNEAPADHASARAGQPVPLAEIAGSMVEEMRPGPELAQWLAAAKPGELNGFSLAGAAAAARRLASWAQARELAAVAEIAARAAVRDDSVPVGPSGGPARVPDDAADEVALALCMSRFAAAWWTTTAITLAWRLPNTLDALRAGTIDLSRAKLIAEATSLLDDGAARAVEDRVLPSAGQQTLGQLRAALRRAVISVDPCGAERRRQEAERRARVGLYGDEEGTATLSGQNLPGAQSAAAMARISALAQAMKSAGIEGGIDLLRAQAFLGLLLGTLPLIPPSSNPADPGPANPSPADPGPEEPGPDDPGQADPGPGDGHPGNPSPGYGGSDDPGPGDGHPRNPSPGDGGSDDPGPGDGHPGNPGPGWPPGPGRPPGPEGRFGDPTYEDAPDIEDEPGEPPSRPADYEGKPVAEGSPPAWPDLPLPGGVPGPGCAPQWPGLAEDSPARGSPGGKESADTRSSPGNRSSPRQEPRARLTVTVPWRTLAGLSSEPGNLCWLGPVTPLTALTLARAAAEDPACEWRVIVTGTTGQAQAVTRVRRSRGQRTGAAGGLFSRITLTVPAGILESVTAPALSYLHSLGALGEILVRAWQAARDAATEASGWQPTGTCAHLQASGGYRPPDRLRDFIVARDQTCRSPICGQPAWRGDLDHTIPYENGGPTCACNLGALCRTHHRLKQRPRWQLEQNAPGALTWTTPAGRRYTATPDSYAA
jgi:hypothetical protein